MDVLRVRSTEDSVGFFRVVGACVSSTPIPANKGRNERPFSVAGGEG